MCLASHYLKTEHYRLCLALPECLDLFVRKDRCKYRSLTHIYSKRQQWDRSRCTRLQHQHTIHFESIVYLCIWMSLSRQMMKNQLYLKLSQMVLYLDLLLLGWSIVLLVSNIHLTEQIQMCKINSFRYYHHTFNKKQLTGNIFLSRVFRQDCKDQYQYLTDYFHLSQKLCQSYRCCSARLHYCQAGLSCSFSLTLLEIKLKQLVGQCLDRLRIGQIRYQQY